MSIENHKLSMLIQEAILKPFTFWVNLGPLKLAQQQSWYKPKLKRPKSYSSIWSSSNPSPFPGQPRVNSELTCSLVQSWRTSPQITAADFHGQSLQSNASIAGLDRKKVCRTSRIITNHQFHRICSKRPLNMINSPPRLGPRFATKIKHTIPLLHGYANDNPQIHLRYSPRRMMKKGCEVIKITRILPELEQAAPVLEITSRKFVHSSPKRSQEW